MKKKIGNIPLYFCGIIFSLCVMLTPVLKINSDAQSSIFVFALAFLGFFAVYYIADLLISIINKKNLPSFRKLSSKGLYLIAFFFFFLVGIWNLMLYFPGTGSYDTFYVFTSDVVKTAKQHPWFYCAIVRGIVHLTLALGGGYETAFVAYCLCQITATSILFAHVLNWLYRKKVPGIILCLIGIYYGLIPVFGLYMVTMLKDIPFSLLLTAWGTILYDFWESEGRCLKSIRCWCLMLGLILFSLLRNNGVYITAFILLSMFFISPRHWKQILVLTFTLICVILGSNAFEKHNKITHLFKETVGIPLQQIAATVTYDGKITDQQLAFIDAVLDVDFIKDHYNPYTADTLKWGGAPLDNTFLNNHKVEFLKTWFELLKNNKGIYLKAYLQSTYGFWSLDNFDISIPYITLQTNAWMDWLDENNVDIKNKLPQKLQDSVEQFNNDFFDIIPCSGTFFWIFIVAILLLVKRNNWKILIVAAPAIGCWGTLMISTPIAYQWRYLLCVPLTLPIIFGLYFRKTPSKVIPGNEQ